MTTQPPAPHHPPPQPPPPPPHTHKHSDHTPQCNASGRHRGLPSGLGPRGNTCGRRASCPGTSPSSQPMGTGHWGPRGWGTGPGARGTPSCARGTGGYGRWRGCAAQGIAGHALCVCGRGGGMCTRRTLGGLGGDACDASKPTGLRDGGLGPPPQAPHDIDTPHGRCPSDQTSESTEQRVRGIRTSGGWDTVLDTTTTTFGMPSTSGTLHNIHPCTLYTAPLSPPQTAPPPSARPRPPALRAPALRPPNAPPHPPTAQCTVRAPRTKYTRSTEGAALSHDGVWYTCERLGVVWLCTGPAAPWQWMLCRRRGGQCHTRRVTRVTRVHARHFTRAEDVPDASLLRSDVAGDTAACVCRCDAVDEWNAHVQHRRTPPSPPPVGTGPRGSGLRSSEQRCGGAAGGGRSEGDQWPGLTDGTSPAFDTLSHQLEWSSVVLPPPPFCPLLWAAPVAVSSSEAVRTSMCPVTHQTRARGGGGGGGAEGPSTPSVGPGRGIGPASAPSVRCGEADEGQRGPDARPRGTSRVPARPLPEPPAAAGGAAVIGG